MNNLHDITAGYPLVNHTGRLDPAARYQVRTWDIDEQRFMPQIGIEPWTGLTLWQLKGALRELRRMGYDCHYYRDADGGHESNDPMVLVEKIGEEMECWLEPLCTCLATCGPACTGSCGCVKHHEAYQDFLSCDYD